MAAETVELHKLKLAELKQECLARGLEAKGNKQDLINRLQAYLEQHAEEEANEEDVLGEETEEEEQKPVDNPIKEDMTTETSPEISAEKKVVKITSEIPQMERMQKRAERFNVPVSLESKKAARAARFGMPTVSTKGLNTESKTTINLDKLKERAQRFGLNVSTVSERKNREIALETLWMLDSVRYFGYQIPIRITRIVLRSFLREQYKKKTLISQASRNTEDDEKLKKRKERFGIVTSSAGAGTTEDTEAKKRKRAERFGLV